MDPHSEYTDFRSTGTLLIEMSESLSKFLSSKSQNYGTLVWGADHWIECRSVCCLRGCGSHQLRITADKVDRLLISYTHNVQFSSTGHCKRKWPWSSAYPSKRIVTRNYVLFRPSRCTRVFFWSCSPPTSASLWTTRSFDCTFRNMSNPQTVFSPIHLGAHRGVQWFEGWSSPNHIAT